MTSNLFLQRMLCHVICTKGCDVTYVMYEIDHVLVIGFTTCMSMSMTTGRSHRSCLYLLYDLRVIEERHVNYFTLLLNALVIEVEVVVGVTTS